ncbi:MAG: SDR family oxidoreductase [Kofleriaceae bacterium]|nr:SDR family oxidoreductase [Kofleriaceae bacterium]
MTTTSSSRVALVTGAGSGIGRAIAVQLAGEGYRLVASDLDDVGGAATVATIVAAGGVASYVHADSARAADHEGLVAHAVRTHGALHVAINNAGIAGPAAQVGDYPLDGWDRVIAVNLTGVFLGMRYQLPAVQAAGGGSIVNISSILGQVGFRTAGAYVAAKHGVVGLTQTAALEYGPHKIRVNAVGPGFVRTPLLEKNLPAEALAGLAALHPLGRLGEASEVAELVAWLASDRASFVTGSYFAVDGGYLAQ